MRWYCSPPPGCADAAEAFAPPFLLFSSPPPSSDPPLDLRLSLALWTPSVAPAAPPAGAFLLGGASSSLVLAAVVLGVLPAFLGEGVGAVLNWGAWRCTGGVGKGVWRITADGR